MVLSPIVDIEISQLFSQCTSNHENDILCSISKEKDIKDVLFHMVSFKGLKLDDLFIFVYKNY